MKQKAEKDLAAVQYEYDEAAEKILNLKDEDIDELRSYHSPPGAMRAAGRGRPGMK